tara:strand:+ start:138 stop:314 length:177 start_codon:yes stop_codon:yes gene_type:complete
MKLYMLDKIIPLLIRCKQFMIAISNSYKIQGIKVPKEVKELKEDLTQTINEIERKEDE